MTRINWERPWPMAGVWTFYYTLHLTVPLLLTSILARHGIRIHYGGIALALAAYWSVGFAACWGAPSVAHAFIVGCFRLLWTQMVPAIQIGAGLFAFLIWRILTGDVWGGPEKEHDGAAYFVVAMLTGLPLLVVAFVFGDGWQLCSHIAQRDAQTIADYDDQ